MPKKSLMAKTLNPKTLSLAALAFNQKNRNPKTQNQEPQPKTIFVVQIWIPDSLTLQSAPKIKM